MLKHQIPNHQLHKISHKTSPSLNNSHKISPSLNSHKARLPLNNNHKVKQPLILNRNLSHHNSAKMTYFQMRLPLPQRLLQQKILDLYQRNQNIVYDQKHSTFNPLYLCFIFFFTDQKKKKIHTRKTHVLPFKCQVCQNFFNLLFTKNNVLTYNIYFSSFFSINQTFN